MRTDSRILIPGLFLAYAAGLAACGGTPAGPSARPAPGAVVGGTAPDGAGSSSVSRLEQPHGAVPPGRLCPRVDGRVEVQGRIVAKGASDITVRQQGKGLYLCEVDASTRIHKGRKPFSFADLQPGWRVHVKGSSLGLAGESCRVDAAEVKVQAQKRL